MKMSRRTALQAMAGAGALAASHGVWAADKAKIKIGFIAPLSGPWARQGELMKKGADLAIAEVNAAGGVVALGGAKLELVVADAGDTPEKAKNAAQRLVAQEPDLVAGQGAWLSSFTLAVTEVTERAGLPWLTFSLADTITARGFRYVFQDTALISQMAKTMLPTVKAVAEKTAGIQPKTTAILADNTAAVAFFTKVLREGGLAAADLRAVVDETFTPPLSDATALVQPLRRNQPDFLLLLGSNTSDARLLLEKMKEFSITIPVVSFGAYMATPELLKAVGPELLEGVLVLVGSWGGKGHEGIIQRFSAETGEPWLTQDSIASYAEILIIWEALESAKSAKREDVAQALRTMDLRTGPAQLLPGGRIKFDDKGRRVDAEVAIVQWQKGVPVTVWPPSLAKASAFWPKK